MRLRSWLKCWPLALFLSLQLAGCASVSDRARIDPFPETKSYASPHGWSLRYPDSWQVTTDTLSDSTVGYSTWIADGDVASGRIQVIESTATVSTSPMSSLAGLDAIDIIMSTATSATTSTVTTRSGMRATTVAARTDAEDAYFMASLSVGQIRYLLDVHGPWERHDELQRVFNVAVASFDVKR